MRLPNWKGRKRRKSALPADPAAGIRGGQATRLASRARKEADPSAARVTPCSFVWFRDSLYLSPPKKIFIFY